MQVLHVVQEALSNVRKHAGATHVSLEVVKGERWRFVVRDNGIGFVTQARQGESHVGMKIMQERAARIGADVSIASEVGTGTVVTLILPAHPISAPSVATVGLADTLLAGTTTAP